MQIKAVYDKTIFETAKDGILVALYRIGDKCKTVKGQMLPSEKNVVYLMDGEWVTHPKYGEQFRCDSFTEDISSEESIIKFLSSSLIKGIGPVLAKRIVEKFGEKTIEIMDNDINQLQIAKIKGLSAKKFEELKESYTLQRGVKEVILIASKYGISSMLAMRCYKEFGKDTLAIFKTKPYKLCRVEGISFPTADRIGRNIPGYEDSKDRFLTCAYYVLKCNENAVFNDVTGERTSGSNCMEINDFGKVMFSLLKIKNMVPQDVLDMTCSLIKEKKIKIVRMNGHQYVMSMGLYEIEAQTADDLANLSRYKIDVKKNIVEKCIKETTYELSEDQKNAVRTAFNTGISIIIGVPGSGKTTTVNTIAKAYHLMFPKNGMYFLAPSGRAAAHIKETLDINISDCSHVSTIHSALEITTDSVASPYADSEIKIEKALVVVDEISMLDSRLAYQLFSSISECMIVLCGDDEQLPSVGSGAVLRDLIKSNAVPITTLTHVYRQEADSDIYRNLYKMRNSETDLVEGNDFHFIEMSNPEEIESKMLSLYHQKISEYGIENVMLLSPMKEYGMGVKNLNNSIQETLHPANESIVTMKYSYEFREGDIVMQTKNDYDTMTMNGDLGVITSINYCDGNDKEMLVKYPHTVKKYTKDNIDELSLGYSYTIHKAQGSEAQCVILCVHKNHYKMLKRNLYYTGITRAKKEIYVVGQREYLNKAIKTTDTNDRITVLENELNRAFGNFFN